MPYYNEEIAYGKKRFKIYYCELWDRFFIRKKHWLGWMDYSNKAFSSVQVAKEYLEYFESPKP